VLLITVISCTEDTENGMTVHVKPDSVIDKVVIITDRTGKKWDISYAFKRYKMDPSQFYYGLGPDAIQPIQNPKFFNADDQGRPINTNANVVIGLNFQGEQRAYPLYVLKSHEVVNDEVNGVPIAVVY
jgi:uncharacterized membrane protein